MKLFGGKGNHTGSSGGHHTTRQQTPASTGGKKLYQESEAERRLREETIGRTGPAPAPTARPAADTAKAAPRRRKKRWPMVVGIIVLVLLCAFLVFQIWVKAPTQTQNLLKPTQTTEETDETDETDASDETDETDEADEPEPTTGRKSYCYTILVVGRDQVSNSTDTVMIAMFDTKNHKLNIVSIPRDTLINSKYDIKKINYIYPAAVNNGNDPVADLQEAVSNILGYSVDSYAIFDINAFVKVIDAMGGIYYTVPFDMYYDDPTQNYHVAIPAGYQWLSGDNAMKVFRFRVGNNGTSYPDGDIGRINTQHDFMKTVAKQMLSVGNIPNLSKIIDVCEESVDTNLTANNMAFFAQEFLKLSEDDINIMTIPANTNGAIHGLSYVFPHIAEWVDMLNESFDPFYDEITMDNLDMITMSRSGQFYTTQGYIAGGEGSFHRYGGGSTVGNESNTDTNDPAAGMS